MPNTRASEKTSHTSQSSWFSTLYFDEYTNHYDRCLVKMALRNQMETLHTSPSLMEKQDWNNGRRLTLAGHLYF
jgi:hypothetical protein